MKMEFVIDKSKWLRGEGANNSMLHRQSDNKYCCLGQVGVQCGIDLGSYKSPSDNVKFGNGTVEQWPEFLLSFSKHNSQDCVDAMVINDDPETSDEEKMKMLSAIVAKNNHSLIFIESKE